MNFGKRLPDALYFHVSGLTNAPPLIRVYEGCATILVGRVDSADVIKLNRIDRKVTYLSYPAFDTEAHPALAASIRCDLKSFDVRVRDFQSYANPPVLHRKDSIVPLDYPARGKFARLTKQEERAGLLGAADIGNRHAWENRLQAAGFVVRGHRLLKMKPPEPDSAP
ncbi:DNA phosphorothioation-associated putative methyltransferase [Geodermatophilus obscurus]|uniref:DNA phosphorothioation-associated putative methyltransferase n=2 Tax=Geodermatophilus obscurus TaxID=1861 RepID=A0A1M7S2I6_9ACTN|nr:DNA phosphorothioation-associated putative methyltransferase [Geodermatophilus obscurus]